MFKEGRDQRTRGFNKEKLEDQGQNGDLPEIFEKTGSALLIRERQTL